MRCTSCGTDNPEGATFCQGCGAAISSQSPYVIPRSAARPTTPVISPAVAERLETIDNITAQATSENPSDSSHTMLFDDFVGNEDEEIAGDVDDDGAVCSKVSEMSDVAAPEEQEKGEESATTEPEPEEPMLGCRVVLTELSGTEYEISLTAGRSAEVIGRDARSVDLPIEDERVSRIHCQLIFNQDDLMVSVEDLGSTNGTRINGAKIEGAQQLHEGDVLRIGHTELTVSLPEQQE